MTQQPKTFTVTEITTMLRRTVESAFPQVRVAGEISRFLLHTSGHIYFDLKDENAVLPCALYRYQIGDYLLQAFGLNRLAELTDPRTVERAVNGRRVVVTGQLSIYDKRPTYQLRVWHLEAFGRGDLHRRFEELKAELQRRGWFDPARKRPLPKFPSRIGVVTSPTGAVIRDILNITARRWDSVDIILYPALVQGDRAAEDIAEGIRFFNRHRLADVLIVGRGGGSLEDLWAFNEEVVARAIYESEIPVVSAVGHETDFTIADFVADKRASTPSAAAELVLTPSKAEVRSHVEELGRKLVRYLAGYVAFHRQVLDRIPPERLARGLLRQVRTVRETLEGPLSVRKMAAAVSDLCRFRHHQLETIGHRLGHALLRPLAKVRERLLVSCSARKMAVSLTALCRLREQRLEGLARRLTMGMRRTLDTTAERLRRQTARLALLDPLGILQRGYSVTMVEGEEGRILRAPDEVPAGTRIVSVLAGGRLRSVTLTPEETP